MYSVCMCIVLGIRLCAVIKEPACVFCVWLGAPSSFVRWLEFCRACLPPRRHGTWVCAQGGCVVVWIGCPCTSGLCMLVHVHVLVESGFVRDCDTARHALGYSATWRFWAWFWAMLVNRQKADTNNITNTSPKSNRVEGPDRRIVPCGYRFLLLLYTTSDSLACLFATTS